MKRTRQRLEERRTMNDPQAMHLWMGVVGFMAAVILVWLTRPPGGGRGGAARA